MKSFKAAIGIGALRASKRKQTGVATIMVILMVGVGLVAVSLGTLHSMRNTQERQLVAHAQVNSQAGAWAAVEAVRQLLATLTTEQLSGLKTDATWNITGTEGLIQSALIKTVTVPVGLETDYKITAEVSAVAAAGQSSSTIEVVYSVNPAGGDGALELSGVLDFYNDLKASGGITLKAPAGEGLDFNVDGDFTAQSVGIGGTGFRNISVTGNISLDSQVAANVVRGRNIKLVQSANVTRAEAWGLPAGEEGSTGSESSGKGYTCCGNITISTWGVDSSKPVVGTAHANGNVDSQAGAVTTILARRDVKLAGKGSASVSAVGNVQVTGWTDKADSVLAGGDLTISGGVGGTGSTLAAVGKADCATDITDNHYVKTKIAANLGANCKKGQVDSSLVAPMIDKVPAVKLKAPVVDAWPLKAAANYAIEFTSDKKVKVTVKNVNGIADDEYYLGHFGKAQIHLCKSVTVNESGYSTCNTGDGGTAKTDAMPFCINHDENTECMSFDFDNKVLSIKADSIPAAMPAGVMWFNGSFKLAGGPFFNTFIATQNIATHGDLEVYSVNYGSDYLINGSSDAVCKNQRGASTFTDYTARYPKNFCSSSLEFKPQAIGNIGLIAGSYNPASPTTYEGGNITLTAKSSIYGTVVAGNILDTSGKTTVYGYITAAGLKQSKDESNDLTASLDVDLTKKPTHYTPDKIPDSSGGGGAGSTAKSVVLWSRYL